jgi:hypothetical protein
MWTVVPPESRSCGIPKGFCVFVTLLFTFSGLAEDKITTFEQQQHLQTPWI